MENFIKIVVKSVDIVVFVVYNRGINNITRKETMKESERLRAENDQLQAKVEQQLKDINSEMEDILERMRGEK